ncbi:MAG: hypothetical protein JSS71_12840 [Armatimonadetes bacterium]|nr:hypothetical protein [Armatimonadota bacterium]MBX3110156.1 hypothetical protein [Fimbriimonadaceae bacterium]
MGKNIYVIVGAVVGVAILGFAGFKQVQSTKSNATEQLVFGGNSGNSNPAAPNDGLAGGPTVGDNQPGGNPMGQGMGTQPEGMQTGPGSANQGGRGQGGFRGMGGQGRPNQGQPGLSPNGGVAPGGPTQPGNSGGRMANPEFDIIGMGGFILNDPKIQAELKLSSKQKADLEEALKPPAAPDGGSNDMQGMARGMANGSVERAQKIRDILDDKQEARMEQLVFQALGPSSLMSPNFRERFSISDEEVKNMQSAMQEAWKSLGGGGNGGFDMSAAMKMKEQLDVKLVAALDADSKAKWKAALGAPFKFDNAMMGGMFGGGGGRRGGGPGGGQGNRPRGGE